jgi:Tfp pilus assembly protein PilF
MNYLVRRYYWMTVVLCGWVVGLTGCQSSRPGVPVLSAGNAETIPSLVSRETEKQELPPVESAKVCLGTAQAMDREGRIGDAIILYSRARQLDPSLTTVCRRLAVLYDSIGEFGQSMREYQEALRLAPRDASIHNDLGYSLYCQGKLQEAEQALRKSVELDPKQDRAWVNLGLTLAMQERESESLQAFQKVLPRGQALCNLGFVQSAMSKREEAASSYRAALQASPDLPIARAALAKLEGPEGDQLLPKRPAEAVVSRPPENNRSSTSPSMTRPVSYEEVSAPNQLNPEPRRAMKLPEPVPTGQSGYTPLPQTGPSNARPVGTWTPTRR